MKRDELLALAERVETATGPEREIDARLHAILLGRTGFVWLGHHYDCDQLSAAGGFSVPKWTASLDAVVALIGEKLPGWRIVQLWQPARRVRGPFVIDGAVCQLHSLHDCGDAEAEAKTLPLALLAAALRALALEADNVS